MFGLFYTLFVGVCRIIQNTIETADSERYRNIAKENGKTIYFDYRGNERLVSNNHRAASGVKDWNTGDIGVKDLKTFKLVENWSENKRIENEKIKVELEDKVKKYNEYNKERCAINKENKPVWYAGRIVIYNPIRKEFFISYRDYDLENDQEVKGRGKNCFYDFHNIFMLKNSSKTKEEIMSINEKIINSSHSPFWYYKEITQFGEKDNFIPHYFKTRKQLIDYADKVGAPYRKERINMEDYL